MKPFVTKFIFVMLIVIAVWGGTVSANVGRNTNWWEEYQQTKAAKANKPADAGNLTMAAANSQQETIHALTADEQWMVDLVNAERVANGLQPLQVDMRIVETAREKAHDMIVNDYFDHQSARLGSPFDQMKAAGIQYGYAGENLAGSSTTDQAHKALMKSPTHRANILFESYSHIGVGVIDGGKYGKMFVQHFILKR